MADWHVHLTMTLLPKCGRKTKFVFRQINLECGNQFIMNYDEQTLQYKEKMLWMSKNLSYI
jgi:hypothetical protein